MIIDCYHGTTSSRARSILSKGFIKSSKPRMWLGTGAYFFQEGYERCRAWAEIVTKRAASVADDQPVVLHAKINMQFGIDLMANSYWPLLREIYTEHENEFQAYKQNGIDTLIRPLTPEEQTADYDHPVDHRLIDILVDVERFNRRHLKLPEPTMVRAAFVEGRPVDRRSWLFDSAAVIISVIDTNCIEELRTLP